MQNMDQLNDNIVALLLFNQNFKMKTQCECQIQMYSTIL
jgi:hypothetical protein